MKGDKYLSKEGFAITKEEWKAFQADETYKVIREFDNGEVCVRLLWSGYVSAKQAQSFRTYWPVFEMRVWNYNDEGVKVPDLTHEEVNFPELEDAIFAYETWLLQWTSCQKDEEGKLIEEGNRLIPPPPPPPPDLDTPASEGPKGLLTEEGAW